MSLPRLSPLAAAAREQVRAAIGQAAQRTGVDFSYLVAQAQSESGLDPTAHASSSSASGLYQFLDQSWLGIVKRHGSEHGMAWAADAIEARPGGGFRVSDPAMKQAVMGLREQAGPAALMAGAYAADNAAGLGQTLGRAANSTDLYFAHFLGLDGAKRFLRAAGNSPDSTAASLFPREARANRSIFYQGDGSARSLGEVYALMGRKLENAGASGDATAAPNAFPQQSNDVQLAYANFDEATPSDVTALLQATDRARIDVLRPTPAQARLAYLMLSATNISA
jgi:hypothetical protein